MGPRYWIWITLGLPQLDQPGGLFFVQILQPDSIFGIGKQSFKPGAEIPFLRVLRQPAAGEAMSSFGEEPGGAGQPGFGEEIERVTFPEQGAQCFGHAGLGFGLTVQNLEDQSETGGGLILPDPGEAAFGPLDTFGERGGGIRSGEQRVEGWSGVQLL